MQKFGIAIIGGGPAGMAAAAEFNQSNITTVLIDAYPQLGGHYYRQPSKSFGPHALTSGARQLEFETLAAKAASQASSILHETSIWNASPQDGGFDLHLSGPHEIKSIHAKIILAAPGAYDRPFPFPGWHLPGVITLGGAQMLLKGHGILPGKRVLVGGSGPLLLAAAAGLVKAGAEVVAMLDMATLFEGLARSPSTFWGQGKRLREGWSYGRMLQKAGVPIKFGQTIFEVTGKEQVEAVTYGPIDGDGKAMHSKATTVKVDTVCAALGFLPNIALTRLLKCEHRYDERLDAFYPTHDEAMESSVSNLFVAGDVTGVGGKELSIMQGQVAAWQILHRLGVMSRSEAEGRSRSLSASIARERRFLDMMCERMRIKPGFFHLLREDTVVCRCEMVTVGQIKHSLQEGATDLRGVKLRTRCGMGACQSRYCEQTAAQLICQETGADRASVGTSSVRPPLIPVLAKELMSE